MSFLHPLGLWGLLGIPILIIIYILKNRYTEQTVASTYMWTLSERFLKRRNPLTRITGIISLILQLLLVAALSLAVAHPIITLKGAAHEYCFVLDGSASMNMETDGKSRFEAAKAEVNKIIDKAESGSVFSLVYVTDITETVFETEDDRKVIKDRIAALECSGGSIDYTDSIGVAQRLFNENSSVLTYLVTDEDCSSHTNVNVINVAKSEVNISVSDVYYTDNGQNSYTVIGNAVSYGGDVMTDIQVYSNIDDRVLGTQRLQLINNTVTQFAIPFTSEEFYSLTVKSATADAMAIDNIATVYNLKSENSYKALLVSNTPFMIESAIENVSNADMKVMTVDEYKNWESSLAKQDKKVSGYGLYIFDAFTPSAVPLDGTVWFIGPTASVEGSGFSVQGEVELDIGAEIELNKSSNSVMKKLTNGMLGEGIFLKKYVKCGIYGNFSTVFTYMGNPMVFTGSTDSGNREVVFAFNFHDSNFALSSDYPILLHNLLDYSFPEVIEKTEYYCGDTAEVNVISGCQSIRVDAPSGESFYADTASAVSEFVLTEVGEYKLTLDMSGSEREYYIYSSVPMEERCTVSQNDGVFNIVGEAGNEGRDGEYDPIVILFILAAVLFTAEWMVYCYEKYQLR